LRAASLNRLGVAELVPDAIKKEQMPCCAWYFTSQDYLRNPAMGLAELRAAGPVVEVRFPIIGKTWITTTNDLAGHVLKDSETFTMRKNGRVAGLAGGCQGGYARSRSAC
jgi:hypothetical protein